jgi:hypothetical protein
MKIKATFVKNGTWEVMRQKRDGNVEKKGDWYIILRSQ